MKQRKERKNRFSLTLLFAAMAFCVLLISVLVAGFLLFILYRLGVKIDSIPEVDQTILFMAVVCLLTGSVIAMFAARIPLSPINQLISKMNQLASGNFSARIEFSNPLREHPAFKEAESSFNKLAQELESTEMLRSDFVNNFSHEFKTPIVSIAGFAKLLKRGNLTEAEKAEYVNVIEEESLRLAYMATNVLNLTKIENQTILTDVTQFNLSEQIRSAVLLLENKWSRKHLELNLEFPEVTISANEELLKQVWINLIDNAVKFSPDYGPVEIQILEQGKTLQVCITNSGSIPEAAQNRIWNKFYQAEESHTAEGNGIGLAIVRRVVELHRGTAEVTCASGAVTFTITLPKKQA